MERLSVSIIATNSEIEEITYDSVVIKTPKGFVKLANDWVISMTGYQPNLDFLEKIGICLSTDEVRKPHYDEDSMETNLNNIYLAGVICGGMNTHSLFIENSRIHAEKIITKILAKANS